MYLGRRTRDLVPLLFRWQTARTTGPTLSALIPSCVVHGHPRICSFNWTDSRRQFQRIASFCNTSHPGSESIHHNTSESIENAEQEQEQDRPKRRADERELSSDTNHKDEAQESIFDPEHLDSVYMTQPFSEQPHTRTSPTVASNGLPNIRKITHSFSPANSRLKIVDYDQVETLRPMRSALIYAIQRRPTVQSGKDDILTKLADDLAYLIQYRFGYTVKEKNLLMVALIHASKSQQNDNTVVSVVTNRNMALLGDSVLALTGKTVFASKIRETMPLSEIEKPAAIRLMFGRANEALRIASTDRLLSKLCMRHWKWPRIMMVHDKKYPAKPLRVEELAETDISSLATFVEAVIAAVYLDSLSFSTAAEFTRVAVLEPMLYELGVPIIQQLLSLPESQARSNRHISTQESSMDSDSSNELAGSSLKQNFWSLKSSRSKVLDLEKIISGKDPRTSSRKLRSSTRFNVEQQASDQVEQNSRNDSLEDRQRPVNDRNLVDRNVSGV
mmetsp:Transcript_11740/g.20160  ORF Transcript_11740/g.20160 Transcript_11740/m.20160 type:complete len:502 (+) Transcript_11740:157-1662(+)|eukprot:CAMPEP_0184702742 /NCGR_PEP_ID=MMETSP0313-20130426/25320_1 /TAXON_ID=2792 /ORGANISM="Porphyridium aerugineum, Strain SAG 1380-2" /LENGTH=501 /DNA_ID=CAMNT_0027163311 /DNA_START=95 /DNA_END=1600 /DNA_ORIENTATION=+